MAEKKKKKPQIARFVGSISELVFVADSTKDVKIKTEGEKS